MGKHRRWLVAISAAHINIQYCMVMFTTDAPRSSYRGCGGIVAELVFAARRVCWGCWGLVSWVLWGAVMGVVVRLDKYIHWRSLHRATQRAPCEVKRAG